MSWWELVIYAAIFFWLGWCACILWDTSGILKRTLSKLPKPSDKNKEVK